MFLTSCGEIFKHLYLENSFAAHILRFLNWADYSQKLTEFLNIMAKIWLYIRICPNELLPATELGNVYTVNSPRVTYGLIALQLVN